MRSEETHYLACEQAFPIPTQGGSMYAFIDRRQRRNVVS